MRVDFTEHEIETAGGVGVNLQLPQPSTITIDDIAHGMANTCRYSGHVQDGKYLDSHDHESAVYTWWGTTVPVRFGGTPVPVHYSIAEHAVYVSLLLEDWGEPWETVFGGLHHDDAESYLSDIARPGKGLLQPQYGNLEKLMDEAVAHGLNAPWLLEEFHRPIVKAADNYMLLTEASELLPSRGAHWFTTAQHWDLDVKIRQLDDPLPVWWQGERGKKREVDPREAKMMYLARHWELMNR